MRDKTEQGEAAVAVGFGEDSPTREAQKIRISIIDYGAGNLKSVQNAMRQVAPERAEILLVREASELADATHIILPGVGAFADCMRGLQALPGMIAALERRVLREDIPFLGICVGMQMLFERGHEHGIHAGLGWLKGEVMPLSPADQSFKVPHMGWNNLLFSEWGRNDPKPHGVPPPHTCSDRSHALFQEIASGDHVYFVHSYHCIAEADDIIATTDYGGAVTAAVGRGNILGVQFHPEKSQRTGLQFLRNFLSLPHHAAPR